MLTIGELAHRTGASRRMLRHWEESGLLTPARVDTRTGRRQYELRQAGRVDAIAALRALGFGLDAIRDLIASELTEAGLTDMLKQRESELIEQASETSTRLREVRTRLASIEKGHDIIMETLTLTCLPALTIIGAQETVTDESEIGDAVARLLDRLPESVRADRDIALAYDGTTDESVITVTAGSVAPAEPTFQQQPARVTIAASEHGVTVTYPSMPSSIGDSWIVLDAQLEKQELRTRGPYRQFNRSDGTVTLQASVVPARQDC